MAIQKPSHTFTKIHLKALRTNIFQILFTLSFTVFINTFSYAQDVPKPKPDLKPKVERDSTKISIDSLLGQPLNLKETDSTLQDSIPKKEGFINDVVTYKAKDYVSFNQIEKKIYLYNEAEVYYQDMEIKSGVIVIDNSTGIVYAGRIKDSLGNYEQAPIFKQGENLVEPDSIIFNTNNKKAIIFNSKTEQSGGYLISEKTRKKMIPFIL